MVFQRNVRKNDRHVSPEASGRMKIKIQEENGLVITSIDGSILQEHVPLFRMRLLELIEQGKTKIILNMGEATYLSSIGLAALVTVKGRAEEGGGDLVLVQTNYLIANLLKITNLHKKIKVFETLDTARTYFISD
ncbi:MAG: anti-sigma factor antagonist [Chitinivibrionales bacterium]|nr:anti-sigma factor antagonist [Chitinivibrionales bacterium]